MQVSKSLLVDSAMILALVLIGVIGYKLSPLLLPRADVFLPPAAGCDLHRTACTVGLSGGGRLRFSVMPRPIPVTEPIEVTVEIEGLRADKVAVDFAGVDMSMGYNRITLQSVDAQRYVGQTTLPVCVTGRMLWQATVLVDAGSQRVAVPFRFEAGNDPTPKSPLRGDLCGKAASRFAGPAFGCPAAFGLVPSRGQETLGTALHVS